MIRFAIVITPAMFAALSRAADRERQDMRHMAVRILGEGLLRRGLLDKEEDPGGQAEVLSPSQAGEGVDQIISASARPSTAGGRHARK